MEKKKVLFVATVVKTHIMQFHLPYLKMFQSKGKLIMYGNRKREAAG